MVKFLIATDLHYQGTNPRGRIDDYPAAIEAKLREVFDIARREQVKAVLIPGDLTNTPGISIAVFRRFAGLLRECPCPILTIHGSPDHDGAAASIERTWYQVLADFNIIHDVESNSWVTPRATLNDDTLAITGIGANPETDRTAADYLVDRPQESRRVLAIHMAHGMLLEKAPGHDFFRYTLMRDVAESSLAPDVLICGHYHPGWGIKKLGRTLFINPGALARNEAAVSEFERPIQVALLEIDGDQIDARLIPLQAAKPGHEVLSRAHLDAEALRKERTAEFMAVLNAQDELARLNTTDIVEHLAKEGGVPENVRTEALRRISDAREGVRVA